MEGFDYFRKNNYWFFPKTPAAALKAYEAHLLPIEAYIHKATSIKPLDEEPYDIIELERVLAKRDLDPGSYQILTGILSRLVKNENAEVALFAAESINEIEHRYNRDIEKIKKNMKKVVTDKSCKKLARLYFELSLLYPATSTIKTFYLKEAYTHISKINYRLHPHPEEIRLFVCILVNLKLYAQALSILAALSVDAPEYLILEIEIEYYRKNFKRVFKLCSALKAREKELAPEILEKISFWLGLA